jgi:putative lipoic acid-binding regulatory protein
MSDKNQEKAEETLLSFPCEFPIKAMGKTRDDFDAKVVGIIRQHVDDIKEGAVTTNTSKGGKFTSVTVTVNAQSKEQLDKIYQSLNDDADIMMTL